MRSKRRLQNPPGVVARLLVLSAAARLARRIAALGFVSDAK